MASGANICIPKRWVGYQSTSISKEIYAIRRISEARMSLIISIMKN